MCILNKKNHSILIKPFKKEGFYNQLVVGMPGHRMSLTTELPTDKNTRKKIWILQNIHPRNQMQKYDYG